VQPSSMAYTQRAAVDAWMCLSRHLERGRGSFPTNGQGPSRKRLCGRSPRAARRSPSYAMSMHAARPALASLAIAAVLTLPRRMVAGLASLGYIWACAAT
jgi:hypothetical protein